MYTTISFKDVFILKFIYFLWDKNDIIYFMNSGGTIFVIHVFYFQVFEYTFVDFSTLKILIQ